MDLKDKLRWVLETRGLSLRKLAERTEVNLASISQMRSGKLQDPRRSTLENLEEGLGLPPGFFLEGFDFEGYLRSEGESGYEEFMGKLGRKRKEPDPDAMRYVEKVHRRAPDADRLSLRDWEIIYEEFLKAGARGGRRK